MEFNLKPKTRKVIYLINLFVTPLIGLLVSESIIPSVVGALWGMEVSAAMALAGLNVTQK